VKRIVSPGAQPAKGRSAVQTHLLHPVVLVIGVLFAMRRLDVSMRAPEQHPTVPAEAFARWKLRASRAYGLGMAACFGKVLLDFAFAYWFFRLSPPPQPVRFAIGLSLDVGWVVLVAVSYWHVRKAHALAREIGVEAPRTK
jgi:hypothetical protein